MVLSVAAILLFLGRLALKAQRAPVTTGVEALLGSEARTLTPIPPEGQGQVRLRGEIWSATSHQDVPAGARVRVAAVNGLVLIVEPQ